MNISRTELYTFRKKVVDYIVDNSFTLEDLVYNDEPEAKKRITSEINALFWQTVGVKDEDFDLATPVNEDWD